MKCKKPPAKITASSPVENFETPIAYCHCHELAPVIEELTRQIHLLGVIIDELVSEFQWQYSQMAEQIRGACDSAEKSPLVSTEPPLEAVRPHRKTLFE